MIARLVSVAAAALALWLLWIGYDQLRALRGTWFWDYRYLVFGGAAFLGLSALEWLTHWIRQKLSR